MRILWTLLKIIIALVIAIPLGILALGAGVAILGTLLGLALLALKVACVGFIGYGLFRVARYFLFGPAPTPNAERVRELPSPDHYYQAAMREVDAHIGPSSSR
jgi:hypothetical protein